MKKMVHLALCLLFFLLPTTSLVPAPKTYATNTFVTKVVSWYQAITDTTIDDLVKILSGTGTEVVFRGYFKYWINPQNEFQVLHETIDAVKARMPWVQFIGGVTASAFYPGDHWPNGTLVSSEEMKQMLLVLPNGAFVRHREDPDHYVYDITKPLARQFILSYAYSVVDAGFDSIWFDEVNYVQDCPTLTYAAAWHEMVSAVKSYAMTKYGKQVDMSMNGDSLHTIGSDKVKCVWPYQDFLTVSMNMETVKSGTMRDDWAAYKAQVMQVYGYLPTILYFIDYNPLVTLASQPTNTQIKLLNLFYDTSVKEQVIPIFPLHYGTAYDAQLEGTYDTIKQLAATISTVHTITTTTTATETSTETTAITTTTTGTARLGSATPLDLVLLTAVVVMAAAFAVSRRRRAQPK